MIILLSSLISVTILAVDSPNAEITGPSFDEPTFFSAGEKVFILFQVEETLVKRRGIWMKTKIHHFIFKVLVGKYH